MYIDLIFTPLTIYLGLKKKNNVGGAGLNYLLFLHKERVNKYWTAFYNGFNSLSNFVFPLRGLTPRIHKQAAVAELSKHSPRTRYVGG